MLHAGCQEVDRPQSYRLRLVLQCRLRNMVIPKGTSRYVGAAMVLQQLQQRLILIEPIHGHGLQFGMLVPKPMDSPRIGSKDMAASRPRVRSPEACLCRVWFCRFGSMPVVPRSNSFPQASTQRAAAESALQPPPPGLASS